VILCPEQVGFAPVVIAMDTDGTRAEFTVIVIGVLLALKGEAHGSFDTISQVTASALTSVVLTNVELVSPAIAAPLRFHWYVGLTPPFVGVAVNVIDCPEQVGFVPVVIAMDTDGTREGFTVVVAEPEAVPAQFTSVSVFKV
jgi:hypothetical protein